VPRSRWPSDRSTTCGYWIDLSLDEGDRGIFISENEQQRRVAFSVENTSGNAETVRLLYATPFAEQEDIDVDVQFSRAPDETDVDDLRGVAAWDLDVAPGETARIEMTVELTWPDEMMLNWRPDGASALHGLRNCSSPRS
jgi:hypothetical protein